MKKKFMGMAMVLASALLAGNVYADNWEGGYGVVSDATSDNAYIGDKPSSTITNPSSGVQENTITYTGGKFKLVESAINEQTQAGDRAAGNSWVGVKVTVPSTAIDQYKVYVDGTEDTEGLRNTKSDYTEWFGISLTRLNATLGGKITRILEFDWNGDSVIDQKVTIIIETMNISLYKEGTTEAKDENLIWSPTIAEKKLADKKAAAAAQKEAQEEAEKLAAEQAKVAEVVSVEGTNVSVSGTTLEESNTTYKEMLEKVNEKGYKTVFGAYELTTVSSIGEEGITLVFKVGTNNNGKAAYVLHQKKDGTFEEFNEVVKDGLVKITVKELSPFMIALGNEVKDDDMPQTSDIFPQVIVGLMALGLAGTYTYKKLHE